MSISPIIRRSIWSALNAALLASLPAAATAQRAEPDVVAGLTLRIAAPASADTIVYRRSVNKLNKDSSTGTRTVVVQSTQALDGTPLLRVVQRFPGVLGEIVDTAIADARSFRAIAHQSHQTARTMRFVFSRDFAKGEVSSVEGPAGAAGASGAPAESSSEEVQVRPVTQAIGGPLFDSNVIEMVVAAMPLQRGFTVEAPFYIYEKGGRVPMAVAVRDQATVTFASHGAREVWVVSVAVPGAPATVWVDSATRVVLRVRYDTAKMSFTDERVTALPR